MKKKRNRRRRLQNTRSGHDTQSTNVVSESQPKKKILHLNSELLDDQPVYYGPCNCPDCTIVKVDIGTMTNDPVESREKVKAAREAKKLAKHQAKIKRDAGLDIKQPAKASPDSKKEEGSSNLLSEDTKLNSNKEQAKKVKSVVDSSKEIKSKDEVDRAAFVDKTESIQEAVLDKDQIKSERAAKKAVKQAKKTGAANNTPTPPVITKADTEMTVRDVIQTLRDIKEVAQDIKAVTAQVQALNLDKKQPDKVHVELLCITSSFCFWIGMGSNLF